MKKIIVAAVAIAMSVVANAASATWNSGTLYYTDGTTKITTAGTVSGYYFNVSSAAYAALTADFTQSAIWDGFTANGASSTLKVGTETFTANKTGSNTALGTLALKDTNTGYGAGDTVYGVLVYTMTEGTTDYYIANAGEMVFASASNKSITNLSNTIGGGATAANNLGGWQAAPEPTSGLLLLLGLAGLALKRKQA